MGDSNWALVLGGGGVVGTAWLIGLAAGLRRAGMDPATADLVIGTSAGSMAGTLITSGADLDEFAAGPRSAPLPRDSYELDMDRLAEMSRLRADTSLEPAEMGRRIGELALAVTEGGQEHLSRLQLIVGTLDWPERALWITALDVETGERVVWQRDSGVALLTAIASSCAVPTLVPPVTVNGRRYMDGGSTSPTNADLAIGIPTLVVFEPLAHWFPRDPLAKEIAAAGPDTVVTIGPDAAAQQAFGVNPMDNAAWPRAYRAGLDQADQVADELHSALA